MSQPLPLRAVKFAAAAACLAAMVAAPAARAGQEWTKSYTIANRASVKVDTSDASVSVTTADIKQVDFRVQYSGYELDKNLHIESRQNEDVVQLTTRTSSWHLFGGFHQQIHVEVRMPKNADLQVSTGDGSVNAGAINGNVDIRTGDGSITINGIRGQMRLRTGDGSIQANQLDGQLEAASGDGHVTVEGRFDQLMLRTGDGSIQAHAQANSKVAGNWNITTGDGSVDLSLPPDFQANIDASTSDGHISLGIPVTIEGTFSNSQIHGKMNGGGQPVRIHTGDGSIRLSAS